MPQKNPQKTNVLSSMVLFPKQTRHAQQQALYEFKGDMTRQKSVWTENTSWTEITENTTIDANLGRRSENANVIITADSHSPHSALNSVVNKQQCKICRFMSLQREWECFSNLSLGLSSFLEFSVCSHVFYRRPTLHSDLQQDCGRTVFPCGQQQERNFA